MNAWKEKKLYVPLHTAKQVLFIFIGLLCLSPLVDTPMALLLGIIFSFVLGNPFPAMTKKITQYLLQFSVVGLGFGMDMFTAIKVGSEGLIFTVGSIMLTLFIGTLLGRSLKINKKISMLISSGTAICGGSAIAATSPIIQANEHETSISLATIFILNSIALFLFPFIGHLLNLSQEQFGFWAAIAIHDTSSVVGAAQHYGSKALEIATMVKLERALWIIPLSIFIIFTFKSEKGSNKKKIKIPYFIFLFLLAIVFNTYVPEYFPLFKRIDNYLVLISKRGLTLTLFLIGAGLSLTSIRQVGVKPLLQGVGLWLFISVFSLIVILLTVN
ncbi:putative sulfate exporter family transporter [Apibacter raozihei]|uniref:YeiH family protein n=1 Tax=Apibacter TaxID=1778601 RepID=UPI000FE3C424|nr:MULTISPECIES: putative sulfate exporter family transporter [Apibacter]